MPNRAAPAAILRDTSWESIGLRARVNKALAFFSAVDNFGLGSQSPSGHEDSSETYNNVFLHLGIHIAQHQTTWLRVQWDRDLKHGKLKL